MEPSRFGLGVFLYVFNDDLTKVMLLELKEQKKLKFGADWANVGGKIRLGETSLEACVREAEEEIGIRFDKGELKLLCVKEIPQFYKEVHAVQFVYGTKLNENEKVLLSPENSSYGWFSLDNLPERLLDQKSDFYDAKRFLEKSGIS